VDLDTRDWLNAWQHMAWSAQLRATERLMLLAASSNPRQARADWRTGLDQREFANHWISSLSDERQRQTQNGHGHAAPATS